MSPLGPIKLLTIFLAGFSAARDELTTAAEIRTLPPSRLAEKLPARITGVVTSIRDAEFPDFTLQDETGGLVAQLDQPVGTLVSVGQRVEIIGVTDTQVPLPRLLVHTLNGGPMVGLPQPLKVNAADLSNGAHDCSYVELSGVIRRARIEKIIEPTRIILDFGPADRRLAVWVSHYDQSLQDQLQPDTAVTVRGICNSWRSPNFQPLSTFIVVSDPTKIHIDEAAPTDSFSGNVISLPELFAAPVDDLNVHRAEVRGVVTLSWPDGQVVLENSEGAIRLVAENRVSLKLGDEVDSVGFPTRNEGSLVLENAIFTPPRPAGLLAPEEIGPRELLSDNRDRDAKLLRISGKFREAIKEDGGATLLIEAEGRVFRATLPPNERLPFSLKRGTDVQIAGVCRMIFSERTRRFGVGANAFELQLPDARAVTLIGEQSWWTPGRMILVIAPLLIASLTWALILRRRVRKRSALLVREIRSRHDWELLVAERMRLATDLHDTLSQSLSGAAMQLEVAGAMIESPEDADRHLVLAGRLLDRSREDLRRTVWDLSPIGLADRSLSNALEGLAGEASSRDCEVVAVSKGNAEDIPQRIRTHLFRVAQEALNNALCHGKPSKVEIGLDVTSKVITMTIADNGCGFEVETAPGPDEGHFGLCSLGERLGRLNGELEVTSDSSGTKITAIVPMK